MYSSIVKKSLSSSPSKTCTNRGNGSSPQKPNAEGTSKNVLLYIDHSNIFESARKYSAKQKGYLNGLIDVACRIDVGKLVSKAVGNRKLLFGKLYGSEPPALDTVWDSIRKKDVEVKTFARSKWTNKEKEVDESLTADAVEDIVEQKEKAGENRTVILFSGDRDLNQVVNKAMKHEYRVEIWSFKNSINSAVINAQRERPTKIQINYIEDIFEQVTFTNVTWGHQPIPRERSMVAILIPPKEKNDKQVVASIFRKFVEKANEIFRMPMAGKYKNNCEHLVLIPCIKEHRNKPVFARAGPHTDQNARPNFAQSGARSFSGPLTRPHHRFASPQLRPQTRPVSEGASQRNYDFYKHIQPNMLRLQESMKDICSSIIVWNEFVAGRNPQNPNKNILSPTRFEKLQIREEKDEEEDDNNEEEYVEEEDDEMVAVDGYSQITESDFFDMHFETDFTPILTKSKPKRNIYSDPCKHKFWCANGRFCLYKHEYQEIEFFKLYPNPKRRYVYKTKLCYAKRCKYFDKPYLCPYAHNLEESRCICCRGLGNGKHWMDQCPNNKSNRSYN